MERKTSEEQGEALTKSEGKHSGKKPASMSMFQRSTQTLNKTKSFTDPALFKQVSKHGKFQYSRFTEKAVATVIFQRKRNPRGKKPYKLQMKQTSLFTISFPPPPLFLKRFSIWHENFKLKQHYFGRSWRVCVGNTEPSTEKNDSQH